MKQFITISPKQSPDSETLSFNPDTVSHFYYKEDAENPSETSLKLDFTNGNTITLMGKSAGKINEILVSLERPAYADNVSEAKQAPAL